MDGKSDLLAGIRESLAAYDDDALTALGGVGLLRRARKDLEELSPEIVGEVEGKLRVKLGDLIVDVRETPSQSSCTCPSAGICRHILTVLLFLRESDGSSAAAASCGHEILSLDEEALRKWAGVSLLRRVGQRLALGLRVQTEGESPIVFTIPALNATCRWMPGGGLSGMICSCHAVSVCEHRVTAVLAYRAANNMPSFESEQRLLEVSPGAPRTREEIRQAVRTVVHDMIAHGVSRVSSSTEQRLRTLAVSAHGVDLPRLERLLRALADEVALLLARDARADIRNLVNAAATAEALCWALERPTPSTVGAHRSQYEPVGSVELIGVGARRWRTRSGYAGLTVYFWDSSAGSWATWTDSRPLTADTFDSLSRYRAPGPWEGCTDPYQASRSKIRLTSACRSAAGRLSGRSSTRAMILGPSDLAQVPAIEHWSSLVERAASLFGSGLGDRQENDEIVLLRPARWGTPVYDQIRQEMTWSVLDADGRELWLVLPHSPETADAMGPIEHAGRRALDSVLGLLRVSAGRLVVEPVSLHGSQGQADLTLDDGGAHSPARASSATSREEDVEEPDDEGALSEGSASPLGLLISSAEVELEGIADAGVSVLRDPARLRDLSARLDELGMACCSRPIDRVLDALGTPASGHAARAEVVLRAYYVCRLASAQEIITSMGEGLHV